MNEGLSSILLGTAGLTAAAVVALFLTLTRRHFDGSRAQIRGLVRVALIAVIFQTAHFSEELVAAFYERFPAVLGLTPWSLKFFAWFNITWLVIWVVSVWGLTARFQPALFPIWFLAIGCAANGIAHPLLSLRTGGYFPGLATSPFVGVVGVLLLQRLFLITSSADRLLVPHNKPMQTDGRSGGR